MIHFALSATWVKRLPRCNRLWSEEFLECIYITNAVAQFYSFIFIHKYVVLIALVLHIHFIQRIQKVVKLDLSKCNFLILCGWTGERPEVVIVVVAVVVVATWTLENLAKSCKIEDQKIEY